MNITNFRDLGGYKAADGRHVKHGQFYRSSAIVFATDADRAAFEKIGMKAILDLRSPMEVAQKPDDSVPGCEYIHCSAADVGGEQSGNVDMAQLIRQGGLGNLTEYLLDIYRNLPFQNPAYQIMFDLMRKKTVPFVFHCTAGKDRTGVAAYLILKVLGVDDETIMADYLLSNEYRKEENAKIAKLMGSFPGAEELLRVKQEYLQLSMDAIRDRYASFEEYLNCEYGITEEDIQMFRATYLE